MDKSGFKIFIFPSKIFWNRFGRVLSDILMIDGVGVDELKETIRELCIFDIDLKRIWGQ